MLRLWKTGTGRLIRDCPLATHGSIAWLSRLMDTPWPAWIAMAGWRWDAETGQRTNFIQAHNSSIFGLACSPDGISLATVSRADFIIKIWYSESLELSKTFQRGKPNS